MKLDQPMLPPLDKLLNYIGAGENLDTRLLQSIRVLQRGQGY